MARDIEEFLRRAAERRNQQRQQQQKPPIRTPLQQQPASRDIVETNEVEIVRQQEYNLRQEDVGAHVRHHISSHAEELSAKASHLGERIQSVDDRVAERIQSKFDHEVGQLEDKPSVQDNWEAQTDRTPVSAVAQDLLQMLRTPKSIRQAILISEILNRPQFDR